MSFRTTRVAAAIAASALLGSAFVGLTGPANAAVATAAVAPAPPTAALSTDTIGPLRVTNSFVSSVGWVKPGDTYPSRILLTNTGVVDTPASVQIVAPTGSTIIGATAPIGSRRRDRPPAAVDGDSAGQRHLGAGARESGRHHHRGAHHRVARPLHDRHGHDPGRRRDRDPPWPQGDPARRRRHGTVRRPPVPRRARAYQDRAYAAEHDGGDLEAVINDPAKPGSTFNLYQEMSLGQLYPDGDVPSAGIASDDFAGTDTNGNDFTGTDIQFTENTDAATGLQPRRRQPCADLHRPHLRRLARRGHPALHRADHQRGLQPARHHRYYGRTGTVPGLIGALAGVGALHQSTTAAAPPRQDRATTCPGRSTTPTSTRTASSTSSWRSSPGRPHAPSQTGHAVLGNNPDRPVALRQHLAGHLVEPRVLLQRPATGPPGYTTKDQLKNLEGRPLWYTDTTARRLPPPTRAPPSRCSSGSVPTTVHPETAIDQASAISHEYGHSLGLPDFYSIDPHAGETYGSWNLMASDHSQDMDAFSRQELGLGCAAGADRQHDRPAPDRLQEGHRHDPPAAAGRYAVHAGQRGGRHRAQQARCTSPSCPASACSTRPSSSTGDKATATHAWWSGSGNYFGCATDGKGPQPRHDTPRPQGRAGPARRSRSSSSRCSRSSGTTTTASC